MTFPFVAFCHYSEQFRVSQAEQFSDGLSGQKHHSLTITDDSSVFILDGITLTVNGTEYTGCTLLIKNLGIVFL